MNHFETERRRGEVLSAHRNWKQKRGSSYGFMAWAAKHFGMKQGTINSLLYRSFEDRTHSKIGKYGEMGERMREKFNLYVDHRDGLAYYRKTPYSQQDQLLVGRVDIDAQVWQFCDKGRINAQALIAATGQRSPQLQCR